ncbi:MAG: glycosyltransferase family 4 protein [Bacteroidales bacterium]|jgi:glycosyltransferase involved in cell wall biosynthesis
MNKVLIITYYWPPSGGAGVQRWLKFSKYLPEFGWEPIILTVDPEYAAYPVTDFSLKEDLPSSVKVYSTPATNYFSIYKKDKSKIPSAGFANSVDNTLKGKILRFIRGNFFLPDPRKGWNKYAFKKACELIDTEEIRHIITTSPPHSTQLIGLKIKKKYPGIKWIADLRDPWTDIYYYKQFYPTFISKRIDLRMEKSVLKKADKIITVGASLKTLLSLKVEEIENKTEVIPNGFDEDDFNNLKTSMPALFTISYMGTLSDVYPIDRFLEALQVFKKRGNDFILRFIGTVSSKQKDIIQAKTSNSVVEFIPYVEHAAALKYMLESTILLLIIPDHQSNRSIITGKLFEYIAAGKPIICLGPDDGDAAGILRETGHGTTFSYKDSNGVLDYLLKLTSDNSIIEKIPLKVFSRRELTRKVVSLLEKL